MHTLYLLEAFGTGRRTDDLTMFTLKIFPVYSPPCFRTLKSNGYKFQYEVYNWNLPGMTLHTEIHVVFAKILVIYPKLH